MTKAELTEEIAKEQGFSKQEVMAFTNAFCDKITEVVAEGEAVTLPGFGKFEQRDQAAREARNPQTGEKFQIPATRVPKFKAGRSFKEAVASK